MYHYFFSAQLQHKHIHFVNVTELLLIGSSYKSWQSQTKAPQAQPEITWSHLTPLIPVQAQQTSRKVLSWQIVAVEPGAQRSGDVSRRGEESWAGQVFPASPGRKQLHLPAAGHVMDRWKRNWLSALALHRTWLKHSVITQTITDIHLLASAGEAAASCLCRTDEGSKGKETGWFRKWLCGPTVSRGANSLFSKAASL